MDELRECAQCGKLFAPRREHARFCSADCRVDWNREHVGEPASAAAALSWSVTAMADAVARVARIQPGDVSRAAALTSEAVWRVTMVDATLVRYYPDAYDQVLTDYSPALRLRSEETLAGLRFVRNQMSGYLGPADFVWAASNGAHAACQWREVPPPACDSLSRRGQEWELERYHAYQARLAGQPVPDVFELAAGFLTRTAALAAADFADGDAGPAT
jgi:hypothetical protein